ncbi:MAG: four helix bundle protein [Caldilinea sp. CFX5]|nr:four helix bundle protein [Caldilinea sp. CFX5]
MAGGLKRVGSFRELLVYQKSRQLALEIFQLTKSFPKEEMFALTDQIRRSSRSIESQIAEAWAKRRYEKHFISKLTDADGEQQETQHWIGVAYDCEYWDRAIATDLREKCQEIGRLLGGMLEKSDQFCNNESLTLREAPVEYIVSPPPSSDDED